MTLFYPRVFPFRVYSATTLGSVDTSMQDGTATVVFPSYLVPGKSQPVHFSGTDDYDKKIRLYGNL